jgi:hypothetical protein
VIDPHRNNRSRAPDTDETLPASHFLESVADTVKRFDHVEVVVRRLERVSGPAPHVYNSGEC